MNSALITVYSQAQDVDLQTAHQVITQLLFTLRSNHLVKLTNGLSQQKMLLQHQNQQKNQFATQHGHFAGNQMFHQHLNQSKTLQHQMRSHNLHLHKFMLIQYAMEMDINVEVLLDV